MATATKEIAIREASSYAIMSVDPREMSEALAVNAGGQKINPFDLDVVKVPSGGMTAWTIPDITEGEIISKTLEGIVLLQRTIRSYWKEDIEAKGGGSPPDCSSQDGIWGRGAPYGHPDFKPNAAEHVEIAYEAYDADGNPLGGGQRGGAYSCDRCPLSEFGTGKGGRGQACKQNKLLFVLTPESSLPLVVKVPPSSLRSVQGFLLRLSGKSIPFYGAVISLSLVKKQNAAGIDYAEIVPSFVARLNPDEVERMRALHETFKPILSGVQVEVDD
jgi:hypothetical protein